MAINKALEKIKLKAKLKVENQAKTIQELAILVKDTQVIEKI
jgi:hypothetical protein